MKAIMSHADHSFDPTEKSVVSFAHYKFSVLHADNTVVLCICRTIYLCFTLQIPTPTRHSPFCRKRPEAQLTGYWHALVTVLLLEF